MSKWINADLLKQRFIKNQSYFTDAILDKIDSQPEATGWIPVTERLPEEAGDYLVTTRWADTDKFRTDVLEYGTPANKSVIESHPERVFDNRYAFGEWWDYCMENVEEVIAWMPLPKAYEQEK